MFWGGLGGVLCTDTSPKGVYDGWVNNRGWGWYSGQNETPSGQMETHLGNLYEKWAQKLWNWKKIQSSLSGSSHLSLSLLLWSCQPVSECLLLPVTAQGWVSACAAAGTGLQQQWMGLVEVSLGCWNCHWTDWAWMQLRPCWGPRDQVCCYGSHCHCVTLCPFQPRAQTFHWTNTDFPILNISNIITHHDKAPPPLFNSELEDRLFTILERQDEVCTISNSNWWQR